VVLIVLSRQITDRTTPAGQLSTADLAAAFGHTFWWILAFAAVAALPALLLPTAVFVANGEKPTGRTGH
jgi:hypothetical protein